MYIQPARTATDSCKCKL